MFTLLCRLCEDLKITAVLASKLLFQASGPYVRSVEQNVSGCLRALRGIVDLCSYIHVCIYTDIYIRILLGMFLIIICADIHIYIYIYGYVR